MTKSEMKELVEARKQEMASMLPGLVTEVRDGNKVVKVESPTPEQKLAFRVVD